MRVGFYVPISVISVALGVSIFAGCATSSPAATNGPWASRIEELRLNSTTDFEKEILADGIVTRAEYDEINQRLVTCMSDAGQTLTLIAQGDYYVYSIPYSDESDGTFMDCQSANGSALAGLYVDTLTNPNNIDPDELMLQCLKREGLLPEDFTLDQYRAGNGSLVLGSDGEISEVSEWALPFSDEQPGFIACTINPSAGTSK